MVILNKGSIHSATRAESDLNQNLDANLRENFAKICFETLLQYSLLDQVRVSHFPGFPKDNSQENGAI